MVVDTWMVQDYEYFISLIEPGNNLVHYFVKRPGKEMMVAARQSTITVNVFTTAIDKDVASGSNYTDYKENFIDTGKSLLMLNSMYAEQKLNDSLS